MPLDDEGAEDYAAGAPSAADYARQLSQRSRQMLISSGHADCPDLSGARYEPESGAVVCPCGVFVPHSESPDNPPWEPSEPDGFDGPIGDGRQGPAGPPPARRDSATVVEAEDPIRSTLALIDPTEIYTPEDVERQILGTLYRLETGQLFEREAVRKAYETKQEFERKFFARTIAHQSLRTDLCKAQAMVDCEAEHAAMLDAEMVMKAVKATMHNLRSVITGYQSVAKSVSATYNAGGSPGGTPPQDRRPW